MTNIIDFVSAKKLKDAQEAEQAAEQERLFKMLRAAGYDEGYARVMAEAPYYKLRE